MFCSGLLPIKKKDAVIINPIKIIMDNKIINVFLLPVRGWFIASSGSLFSGSIIVGAYLNI